jgi:hypothetical protein
MFTYQIRKRYFKVDDGKIFVFPNDCEIKIYFSPKQPFGESIGGGRTTVKNESGRVYFNANNGIHSVESSKPLKPLTILIEEESRITRFEGTKFSIKQMMNNEEELYNTIESLFFVLPLLINIEFADPPIIERVDGNVGDVSFLWLIKEFECEIITTTQEKQEKCIVDSWKRLEVLSSIQSKRIISALHYFHVAVRLNRIACIPGEFMAEVLINIAKVLDILFQSKGKKQNDRIREGLKSLGYSSDIIERDFIPACLLRNSIDSGHAFNELLEMKQLEIIQTYTEKAERNIRELLKKILSLIITGEWSIPPDNTEIRSKETDKIIEKLGENQKQEKEFCKTMNME